MVCEYPLMSKSSKLLLKGAPFSVKTSEKSLDGQGLVQLNCCGLEIQGIHG